MIEIKNIRDVSSKIRSIYRKGIEAADKNNPDYAIDLLKTVVIMEPGFLQARESLRSIEKQSSLSMSIKNIFKYLNVKKFIKLGQINLARKRFKEAYTYAEEALAINVRSLSALNLLAEIAELSKAPFLVIQTYELACEFYPENPDVLRRLADAYRIYKKGVLELKIRQKLVNMFPDDPQGKTELRSASASAILEKKDLENEDSSRVQKLININKGQVLEQKERGVHSIDSIQKLINKYKNDLMDDTNSIATLRKLGELYQKSGEHVEAFKIFKRYEEVSDVFDIAIDKLIEKSDLALIEHEIENLIKSAKDESPEAMELNQKTAKLRQQLIDTREAYAIKRINLYPNDLLLRYSLALIYFENEKFDLAIEQFQLSQQNLQYHISSLLFLGRCFLLKKQFDIAIQQFKKVVDEFSTMTEQKMEALYYLGIAYEKINDSSNAMDCFKQIYSVQSTYKDIATRVQKYYE